jgi:putative flavoprotein involved in K+ transport
MPAEQVQTLIIGGGQAGLVMSYRLKQRGLSHLVLERHQIAERWRSERWDGLRFQFPNWSVRLPDFPFAHSDPDAFASSGEILDYISAFAAFVAPPIRCGVAVTALRRRESQSGFIAETADGAIEADSVVVATGAYQRAIVPNLLGDDAGIFQVHASRYSNPDRLPPGAVLVVGCGASGAQITEELFRAGRQVFLSIGCHTRVPRRYRGRDLMWWMSELGLLEVPPEQRGPIKTYPVITGAYGGHTVDFRRFAADGVTLLGRLQSVDGDTVQFASDLAENLATGDAAYTYFLDLADAHASREHPDMPQDPDARARQPDPSCVTETIERLDFRDADIAAVIWATGYGFDFSWIDIPVLNSRGAPVHRRGITEIAGLYFLGLPWLTNANSSFLSGVGEDATVLADHIAGRG